MVSMCPLIRYLWMHSEISPSLCNLDSSMQRSLCLWFNLLDLPFEVLQDGWKWSVSFDLTVYPTAMFFLSWSKTYHCCEVIFPIIPSEINPRARIGSTQGQRKGEVWTPDLRIWSPLLHWLSYKARTGAGCGFKILIHKDKFSSAQA